MFLGSGSCFPRSPARRHRSRKLYGHFQHDSVAVRGSCFSVPHPIRLSQLRRVRSGSDLPSDRVRSASVAILCRKASQSKAIQLVPSACLRVRASLPCLARMRTLATFLHPRLNQDAQVLGHCPRRSLSEQLAPTRLDTLVSLARRFLQRGRLEHVLC